MTCQRCFALDALLQNILWQGKEAYVCQECYQEIRTENINKTSSTYNGQ